MEEFKPDLIKNYVDQLGTENLIVMVESKTFESECTKVEPIYQSKYMTEPLGDIQPLNCNVALPEHNFFIPNDLTVLPLGTQKHPRKIYQSDFIEAFFKEDHEFSLPKA
jgi:secreted Zn-dependent insulinase-like peptidase